MRSRMIAKNLLWAILYQVILLALGFIAPRFIILAYGSEINGLQSTISQIVNIIALLQSGVGAASTYLLYRPIAEKDYDTVSIRIYSTIKYFRKIAILFFLIMFLCSFIFAWSMKKNLTFGELFICFFLFGLKSALDIYYTSGYVTLFAADQSRYVISIANLIEKIIYYILLFIAIFNKSYFIWLYIDLVIGCIIKIVYCKLIFQKKYSRLINLRKEYRYIPINGRNYSMLNEISHSIVSSSIYVLFSYMYGLEAASIFSIYNLVIILLMTIGIVVYESFASSYGNLNTENNIKKSNKIFASFLSGFNAMNTILYICAAFLMIPFISLYTQGMTDVQYINRFLGINISIYGIVYTFRIPYNILVSTNGLFKETSLQPFVFMIISIVSSIIFGSMKRELILIGPIIFYIGNFLYQKVKIPKLLTKMDLSGGWDQIVFSIVGVFSASILSWKLKIEVTSIWNFILYGILSVFLTTFIVGLFYFIKYKKDMKLLIDYFVNFLNRRKKDGVCI